MYLAKFLDASAKSFFYTIMLYRTIGRYELLGAMIVTAATIWPRWRWWLGRSRVDLDRPQVDLEEIMPPRRRRRFFTRGRSLPRDCDSHGSIENRTKQTLTFSWHMAWQWRNVAIPNYRCPFRRPLFPQRSLTVFEMKERVCRIWQHRAT